WIWSLHAFASCISTFFLSHSSLIISPILLLYFPYIICLLYFGAKTRWYLHLHCVCAKLFLSFIGHASFYDEIWWSGNQPYLTMKRGFFYPTLEALWNPRHSQGFSNTIKEEPTNEEQTDDSHVATQTEPAKEAAEEASNNVIPAHQEDAAAGAQVNNTQSSGIDVKEVSTEYLNYFIQLFKNPTEALRHTENEFINGIINIILYAVTFGIGIYYTINALDTIT